VQTFDDWFTRLLSQIRLRVASSRHFNHIIGKIIRYFIQCKGKNIVFKRVNQYVKERFLVEH
jgi:hypothetical protein